MSTLTIVLPLNIFQLRPHRRSLQVPVLAERTFWAYGLNLRWIPKYEASQRNRNKLPDLNQTQRSAKKLGRKAHILHIKHKFCQLSQLRGPRGRALRWNSIKLDLGRFPTVMDSLLLPKSIFSAESPHSWPWVAAPILQRKAVDQPATKRWFPKCSDVPRIPHAENG